MWTGTCEYPGPPSGLELIPDRGTVQDSWFGPQLQISNINGEDQNQPSLDTTEIVSHGLIAGVSGATSCTRTFPDEGQLSGQQTMTLYDGGVMGEVTRSSNLKYRSFQFKKPEDRDAAIAVSTDTVNPGLMYAHSFAGINGCAIEIVLEVAIQSTGGVVLIGDFPFESMAVEREKAVRGSVSVCATTDEIIVYAGIRELREAQNVEYDEGCETGMREMLRFSCTFVCKTTGSAVQADFQFFAINGPVSQISTDCTNPTPYQTNPPSPMALHQSATFQMTLSPAQAPQSCGAMYWDPLLAPLDFGEGDAPTPGSGFPMWVVGVIVGGAVVALVILAVCKGGLCCLRNKMKRVDVAPVVERQSADVSRQMRDRRHEGVRQLAGLSATVDGHGGM